MAKTIILTDLVITDIGINYVEQHVKVTYKMIDDANETWITGTAYFWVELPALPRDGIDFLLPPSYVPTLLQLRTDADAALTAKFLV